MEIAVEGERSSKPYQAKAMHQGEQARIERNWRRTLQISVVAVLLGVAAIAQAQDGRAILQKSLQAYQSLSSYDGTATVETEVIYNGTTPRSKSFSSVLKYKRPNKLMLTMTAPDGTRSVYSDGAHVAVYFASPNQYTRDPAPPTLSAMLPLLFVRAGVIGALDPLYFLGQKTLPPELGDLKSKGSASFSGQPVFVVTGVTRTGSRVGKTNTGKRIVIPPSIRYWTWWIDKKTYLIRRIETRTPNMTEQLHVREKNKIVARNVTFMSLIRHTIQEVRPNSTLADNIFVFTPPAGAIARQSMADLLKHK